MIDLINDPTMDAELSRDEGVRQSVYRDTTGNLTAGIGRNLSAVSFSQDEIALMFVNDKKATVAFLDTNLSYWRGLDIVRQRVIFNMAFNLRGKLLGFVNMLAALKRGDYVTCAAEMKNSLWYSQVGQRGVRLCFEMLRGTTMPGTI